MGDLLRRYGKSLTWTFIGLTFFWLIILVILPDFKLLEPMCKHRREITIAHLINRRFAHSTNAKDYEFSRMTVRQLWEAGLEDVRRTVANREWLKACELISGVRVFDLAR